MNMEEERNMVLQPVEYKRRLMPHQLVSIYDMEKLESGEPYKWKIPSYLYREEKELELKTSIGINSDITGYGKTLSMIGLIVRDKMEWDCKTPYIVDQSTAVFNRRLSYISTETYTKINATLVLMSKTILKQWEKELSYTHLKVITITKKNRTNAEILNESKKHPDGVVVLVCAEDYNSLVKRYTDNTLSHRYDNLVWKRFIYDEPTQVKVANMCPINTRFIWLVTATPIFIYDKHRRCMGFMKQLLNNTPYMMNWRLDSGAITVKNDEKFVRKSFEMPETKHLHYRCSNPIYRVFTGIANDRVTRLVEAGDISSAIELLGGKKTDNIIELLRKQKEDELHIVNSEIKIREIKQSCDDVKKKWTDRRDRLLKQLGDLESRYQEMLSGDCTICYETVESPVMETNCQNIFCGKCLLTWLRDKNTCPLCRSRVGKEDLVMQIDYNAIRGDGDGGDCGDGDKKQIKTKYETISDIIQQNTGGKFIIFSARDNSFTHIRNILREHKIQFNEVKGSVDSRHKKLEEFRNGTKKVIFLNSRFNGAGINLQEATDLVIYHPMGEGEMQQIVGRANRIGRKHSLNIHHLLYNDESI